MAQPCPGSQLSGPGIKGGSLRGLDPLYEANNNNNMKVHKCTLANILKAPEFSILNIHIVYFIKIDKSNKFHSLFK